MACCSTSKTSPHPKRLDDVADAAFSFWHSATFNNDATKLLFSDEWGGGTQPMCQSIDPPMWGGDAVYNIQGTGDGRHLHFGGYYKMPAWQTATENCVAHNGSLVPVPGRDIMSQAFYQGGATVFDFTDPAHIQEIAYFDRGPIDADQLIIGGYWSVYYYNGYLYGSEIARGLDVFELTPSEYLSQNEIDAAKLATREGCGASERFQRAVPAALRLAGQLRRRSRVPRSAHPRQGAAAGTRGRPRRGDEAGRKRECIGPAGRRHAARQPGRRTGQGCRRGDGDRGRTDAGLRFDDSEARRGTEIVAHDVAIAWALSLRME